MSLQQKELRFDTVWGEWRDREGNYYGPSRDFAIAWLVKNGWRLDYPEEHRLLFTLWEAP
jgi:hypothetical protein